MADNLEEIQKIGFFNAIIEEINSIESISDTELSTKLGKTPIGSQKLRLPLQKLRLVLLASNSNDNISF